MESRVETGVYVIRCTENGKVYVGSTAIDFRKRLKKHFADLKARRHKNDHLQSAYNKYGPRKFTWQVKERCLPDLCLEREQYWMGELKSADRRFGYNICPTAGNSLGMKHTEETKKKVSETKRKQFQDNPELRAKMSRAAKARPPRSEETRAKISEALSKRIITPETRAKLSKAKKNCSEETREKLRESRRNLTLEQREMQAEATAKSNRERVWTPEMRAKASAKHYGVVRSKEARAKQSASCRGRKLSEETKRKMSESRRLWWEDRKKVSRLF